MSIKVLKSEDVKVIRVKARLSQKEFGERICVKAQTVQKYESGDRNIPESIQKLIRYEFAKQLPEEDRLYPEGQAAKEQLSADENQEYINLKKENENLKAKAAFSDSLQQIIDLQKKTIQSLEDQVKLYKDRLNLEGGRSKTA